MNDWDEPRDCATCGQPGCSGGLGVCPANLEPDEDDGGQADYAERVFLEGDGTLSGTRYGAP